ncbi:MAG: putative esterase [Saprospiraceae bacterium]|jgi:predicted esterase
MHKLISSLAMAFSFSAISLAQTQINNSIPFQTEDSKDYSLVIPSSYIEGEATAAFLALHPWNTSKWNGETWCEELSGFAEANNVILVCPDGGADGKIDDPIDTAFTTFILDSAFQWYDIDPAKLYAIGFSWGGKTTYTYGLNHMDKFAGLLPIGAAINAGDVDDISQNIDGKPVYIVHGSLDMPDSRFYPLIDAMESNGACIETNLLPGVGHTIEFDNQVAILTAAYDYLKDNACTTTSTNSVSQESRDILPYNSIESGVTINLISERREPWSILTKDGKVVKQGNSQSVIFDLPAGLYILHTGNRSQKFTIQ